MRILFVTILALSIVSVHYCDDDDGVQQSSSLLLRAGNVLNICQHFQKYEILFTNKCHLEADKIEGYLNSFGDYVRTLNGEMMLDKFLTDGLKDSTKYFQTTYPQYSKEYKDFENAILKLFNDTKLQTKNTTIKEFVDAFKFLDKPYNEITQNPSRECDTKGLICPVLEKMFNINEDIALSQTLDRFMANIIDNTVNFLKIRERNEMKFESIIMTDMNLRLGITGTSRTNIKKIRQIILTDFFKYLKKINKYTPDPPKTETTTKQVVRKTTLQAVTISVYLSVPLMLVAVGVIVCILVVVVYYKMQPNVGGDPTKTRPEKF